MLRILKLVDKLHDPRVVKLPLDGDLTLYVFQLLLIHLLLNEYFHSVVLLGLLVNHTFDCRLAASEYCFCGRVAVTELSFRIVSQVCEIVTHVRRLLVVPLLLASYVDLFHVFEVCNFLLFKIVSIIR